MSVKQISASSNLDIHTFIENVKLETVFATISSLMTEQYEYTYIYIYIYIYIYSLPVTLCTINSHPTWLTGSSVTSPSHGIT